MKSIKAMIKCVDSRTRAIFPRSKCLVTISVGQQTHEGAHFEATVDLINRSFHSCVMLIDDSLQRHNMALNRKEDAAYFHQLSIQEGDLWLERNERYLRQFKIPLKIMRWEHWLNHDRFSEQHALLKRMYNENAEYRATFCDAIDEFMTRYRLRIKNLVDFNEERAVQLCLDFILEECAALSLWPELGCQFEVYPGLHNAAIEKTRELIVSSQFPGMIRPVTIAFRNAKQLAPQRFYLLKDEAINSKNM